MVVKAGWISSMSVLSLTLQACFMYDTYYLASLFPEKRVGIHSGGR